MIHGRHFSLLHATLIILFLLSQSEAVPQFSCDRSNPATKSFPFCDDRLPIAARAKDLVSRLTVDEKIKQLINTAAPIPRLNISGYQWWAESPHVVTPYVGGMSFDYGPIKNATMFPQIIHMVASFDTHQWYRIAKVIILCN